MIERIDLNKDGDKVRVHHFESHPLDPNLLTTETKVQEFKVKNSMFFTSTDLYHKDNKDAVRIMYTLMRVTVVIAVNIVKLMNSRKKGSSISTSASSSGAKKEKNDLLQLNFKDFEVFFDVIKLISHQREMRKGQKLWFIESPNAESRAADPAAAQNDTTTDAEADSAKQENIEFEIKRFLLKKDNLVPQFTTEAEDSSSSSSESSTEYARRDHEEAAEKVLAMFQECKEFRIHFRDSPQNAPFYEVVNAVFDRDVNKVDVKKIDEIS